MKVGLMAGRELRGKVFDDGVTRYYDPTKHSWLTKEQIEEENRGNEISNYIYLLGSVAVVIFTIYSFWTISIS